MINYKKFELENGLRVIVHENHETPMACVNVLYDVGARDEQPDKTGFAHLFEHLMFGGSVHIPNFDSELQKVGGENNAFTSNDITNYYIQVPAVNIETALWLESDRMLSLAFSPQSLEVQRNVVIEEFKQRYLNQPYGDVWLKLRPLVYTTHPYQWATIGKDIAHIEEATMEDVKAFFERYYHPSNSILSITGDVDFDNVKELVKIYFGDIPDAGKHVRSISSEPVQHEARRAEVFANVPVDAIYIAFVGPSRMEPEYYVLDLISDVLSRGSSSRLYRRLVKEKAVFSEVNAYLMGSLDQNMFVVEGKPVDGVTLEEAEQALWEQLDLLKDELIEEEELQKVKNKVESTMVFSELSILDKAMNLGYYELLGDAGLYQQEVDKYFSVTREELKQCAQGLFQKGKSSTLLYRVRKENDDRSI